MPRQVVEMLKSFDDDMLTFSCLIRAASVIRVLFEEREGLDKALEADELLLQINPDLTGYDDDMTRRHVLKLIAEGRMKEAQGGLEGIVEQYAHKYQKGITFSIPDPSMAALCR